MRSSSTRSTSSRSSIGEALFAGPGAARLEALLARAATSGRPAGPLRRRRSGCSRRPRLRWSWTRGSSTTNRLPSPGWLTTRMSPPWRRTMLVADRQPETGAAGLQLGGEEGLEDLLQLRRVDAGAVVLDSRATPSVGSALERHRHLAAVLAGHRLEGVDHQVGEHLLQLAVVARRRPARRGRRAAASRARPRAPAMRSLSRSRHSSSSGASRHGAISSRGRLRANSSRLLTICAARKVCFSTFLSISWRGSSSAVSASSIWA